MEVLEYKRADNVINTPVWTKLPMAIAEIIALGYSTDTNHFPGYDEAVFYASVPKGVVGFMTYKSYTPGIWAIGTAWVDPLYRSHGIHTELFQQLVARAKDKGIQKITTGTHVNNRAARVAFEKQGRIATIVSYEYRVFEELDERTLAAAGVKP